ncbi:hypothetical protein H633G_11232 [Metarhizium anisopliae BRIP 53284]|nr:hypothetical protein H633G_11232 [Metarhizium anisopliae BRIP 53284]
MDFSFVAPKLGTDGMVKWQSAGEQKEIHTTLGIRWSSPIQLLIQRSLGYQESKPKTDQECQQKYLPKWRECNNERACQSQVKKDYEACKEQVKSTQAKPEEPEEPQPKTDQECRDKYSPKWQQCRNNGTCQNQVRKDFQACLEQVKTAQAKPSTPAQPAQPKESKPKTDQECQQKYYPKWLQGTAQTAKNSSRVQPEVLSQLAGVWN